MDSTVVNHLRAMWLCSRAPSTSHLPRLPVLNASNRGRHPRWHAYYESVYKTPVWTPVDLNTFEFFYWSAPLRPQPLYRADWQDDEPEVATGTPWIGGPAAAAYGPEHLLLKLGFFVHRARRDVSRERKIEVLRAGPNDFLAKWECKQNQSWFYPLVGTGVFLVMTRTGEYAFDHVEYNLQTSARRVEMVVRHHSPRFWPSEFEYVLGSGEACNASVEERVLTCTNRPSLTTLPLPIGGCDDATAFGVNLAVLVFAAVSFAAFVAIAVKREEGRRPTRALKRVTEMI